MARPRSRLVALLAVAGLAITSVPSQAGAPPRVERDPRRELGLFVDPKMPAAQEGAAYADIARRPQALWLSNEYYPREQVADVVRAYTSRAAEAGKTPMLVVYAIPDRDCGQHSSGGLPGAATYQAWVAEVAAGIRGSKPLLVLEPDAIGFYGQDECSNGRERLRLLRSAVRRLSAAGAWVYLDAGHSGWTPYADRARLLKTAGVGLGRGLSTNVSNFRRLGAEKAYAELLLRQLRQDGVKGLQVRRGHLAQRGAPPRRRRRHQPHVGAAGQGAATALPGPLRRHPVGQAPGRVRRPGQRRTGVRASGATCSPTGCWAPRATAAADARAGYQPQLPGTPLNGPTTRLVIQPP